MFFLNSLSPYIYVVAQKNLHHIRQFKNFS